MNNIDPLAVELVFKFVRRQERAARRLHSEATTATRSAVNTYGVEDNWCILPYLSVRALPAECPCPTCSADRERVYQDLSRTWSRTCASWAVAGGVVIPLPGHHHSSPAQATAAAAAAAAWE